MVCARQDVEDFLGALLLLLKSPAFSRTNGIQKGMPNKRTISVSIVIFTVLAKYK